MTEYVLLITPYIPGDRQNHPAAGEGQKLSSVMIYNDAALQGT